MFLNNKIVVKIWCDKQVTGAKGSHFVCGCHVVSYYLIAVWQHLIMTTRFLAFWIINLCVDLQNLGGGIALMTKICRVYIWGVTKIWLKALDFVTRRRRLWKCKFGYFVVLFFALVRSWLKYEYISRNLCSVPNNKYYYLKKVCMSKCNI